MLGYKCSGKKGETELIKYNPDSQKKFKKVQWGTVQGSSLWSQELSSLSSSYMASAGGATSTSMMAAPLFSSGFFSRLFPIGYHPTNHHHTPLAWSFSKPCSLLQACRLCQPLSGFSFQTAASCAEKPFNAAVDSRQRSCQPCNIRRHHHRRCGTLLLHSPAFLPVSVLFPIFLVHALSPEGLSQPFLLSGTACLFLVMHLP